MKNPFSIRQFTKSDATSVKQVALASWQYTYKDIFTEEQIMEFNNTNYSINGLKASEKYMEEYLTEFLVVEDKRADRIIGFSQLGYTNFWSTDNLKNEEIQLLRIYLHPDYIGKGLGKQLLSRSEEFVKNCNRNKYIVYVHKKNNIGIRFYEKNGFTRVKERDEDDALCYIKTLDTQSQ